MSLIKYVLSGMAIGVANVIPGVSGGTIAFILGIYEKLTESIGEFLTNKEKRKEYSIFLAQIGVGVVIGIALFAKLIEILYLSYEEPMNFFFLGLIIASIPFIFKSSKDMKLTKERAGSFCLGAIIILVFIFLGGNSETVDLAKDATIDLTFLYSMKLYFCGVLAAGAMVIPGVSGSFLLILLGEYYNVIGFVNNREILPLGLIAIGAISGVFFVAKIIDIFMKKYHSGTIYFITGLVVASVFEIWPGISFSGITWLLDILAVSLGYVLAFSMSRIKK